MKAIWNGKVIAESKETIPLENNQYFPPDSVNRKYLKQAKTHTTCPWKGEAAYYDVVVDGKVNKDAAWYYPNPNSVVVKLTDYIAFWKGVEIVK